jgi:hypothetical protein
MIAQQPVPTGRGVTAEARARTSARMRLEGLAARGCCRLTRRCAHRRSGTGAGYADETNDAPASGYFRAQRRERIGRVAMRGSHLCIDRISCRLATNLREPAKTTPAPEIGECLAGRPTPSLPFPNHRALGARLKTA